MKRIKTLLLLVCLIVPFFFAGCENERRNSLSVPNQLNVATNGIISFEMVEDAEYYTIQINDFTINVFANADDASGKVQRVDNYLKYDASKILTLGETYDIKVKANAEKKASSGYTNVITYRHAVSVDKPSNVKINGTTLTWDAVEHASYYEIKVLAPYNNIHDDSAESIEKADLTEYRFTSNKFNFNSLLKDAGVYKLYINAVSLESNHLESGYTTKIEYMHNVDIATPENISINLINDYNEQENKIEKNYHLTAVVDSNANFLVIRTGDIEVDIEITSSIATDNVIDINLNEIFAERINFDVLGSYSFEVCAGNSSSAYNTSEFSSPVSLNNFVKLDAPVVEISYDELNVGYQLSWNEVEGASGYEVYVTTATGTEIISVDADVNKFLIKYEFISATVRAIGSGNLLSSNLGNICCLSSEEIEDEVEFNLVGNTMTWTAIEDAEYIIEIQDEIILTGSNEIDLSFIEKPVVDAVKVYIIKDGFMPYIAEVSLTNYRKKLEAPYFALGQGFTSSSLYVLTFTGVENAMGYRIYLNDVAISKVFTDTTINLARYITNGGEYKVKIQAIADKYSIYLDSEYSNSVTVVHEQVLASPTFIGDGVEKVQSGNSIKYYLNFNGVGSANRYEILINSYPLTEIGKGAQTHRIDITSYLAHAGEYNIMIRSLPIDGELNTKPSAFNSITYLLTKQLEDVTNIKVNVRDDVYTLSFDTQTNASSYQVRILKLNDSGYSQYLEGLGLNNPFTVYGACDITQYLKQAGEYYIYVTAIAQVGGAYANSDESKSYATVNKLSTLKTPSTFEYNDASNTEFYVRWQGDEFADYYIVTVIDPNNIEHEFKANSTLLNINDCITIQGQYLISAKSMVNTNGENSIYYSNSPVSEKTLIDYRYVKEHDFTRYSVYMNGGYYNFNIQDLDDIKYVLYYHYLYEINPDYELRISIELQSGETVLDAVKRLATEATAAGIYDFSSVINDSQYTSQTLLKLLCEKVLKTYPEMNILSDLDVSAFKSNVYDIYYKNLLNENRIDDETNVKMAPDYGNKFEYLPMEARRNTYTTFAIDSYDSMNVTTTEQLLHAVQYGKKPNFVGNSTVAEHVYANAKQVLVAIANNKMSDYEKSTAIFDWLEYALNLNYKSEYYADSNNNSVVGEIENYGYKNEYYLEGVFANLLNSSNSGYDGTFYLGDKRATSESYSKAYTLLAGIEGLTTRKVNGTYSYIDDWDKPQEKQHAWNKIKLNGKWYNVDLTFSDNASFELSASFGISSHLYYLVSDVNLASFKDLAKSNVIEINANKYDETQLSSSYISEAGYNYYLNTDFTMKATDVNNAMGSGLSNKVNRDLSYPREFNPEMEYAVYDDGENYSAMQNFMFNNLVNSCVLINKNGTNYAMIEFRFNWEDNNNNAQTYAITNDLKRLNEGYLADDISIVKSYNKQNTSEKQTTYIVVIGLA